MHYRSHLVSLLLMSMACVISVREYYKEHIIQSAIEQDIKTPSLLHPELYFPQNQQRDTPDPSIILANAHISDKQQRTVQVGKGDTLSSLLKELGTPEEDIEKIKTAIKGKFDSRDLKVGQAIVFTYKEAESEDNSIKLLKIKLNASNEETLYVKRLKSGAYKVYTKPVELFKETVRVDSEINGSFYNVALKKGIPSKVVSEAVTALSYIINFQHGIKKGDSFEILYDAYKDKDGNVVKAGALRYVAMMTGNTYNRIYRFDHNGHASYYDAKGQSIVRSLLQTPIDPRKMRITSHFGSRIHPLKGYRKDHKGVDFGASVGTAVMSAGDGVVVKMGYYGGYGKYIKVKHSSGYETAYAHLSNYGKNIRVGSPVQQRQIIGYVGMSGSVTGPHLHFEVIHNNNHVNPMKVKQMPSKQLSGPELTKFNHVKRDVETQIVGLAPKDSFATLTRISDTAGTSIQ